MKKRRSGILLHISSLPSSFGVGDLGPSAYRFADFLSDARQSAWQILPINPTRVITENSPYSSISAFAGNPLFISPELLYKEGFLSKSDLQINRSFPKDRVDYPACTIYKASLFKKAYRCFKQKGRQTDFEQFCYENRDWLQNYSLFVALTNQFKKPVSQWPTAVRRRDPKVLATIEKSNTEAIEEEKFLQFLFYRQWHSLKKYCNHRNIKIIGDLPIYVYFDSVEVWIDPTLFKVDKNLRPSAFAGVPPDFFSATGQLWTNPIYQWDVMKKQRYRWWVQRVSHNLKLFDRIRLDHFKGFVDYWEVPASEKTAIHGRWVKGPRKGIFDELARHFSPLPFIAEDLGVITKEVHALRDRYKLPGMRVLQFAFGNDPLAHLYQPHAYIPNSVAYTGTHDNDTLMGWLFGEVDHSTRSPAEIQSERESARRYLGPSGRRRNEIQWSFIRMMVDSPANLVIFPLQDILGLGTSARMNRPGVALGNWEWRVTGRQLTDRISARLGKITLQGGRG